MKKAKRITVFLLMIMGIFSSVFADSMVKRLPWNYTFYRVTVCDPGCRNAHWIDLKQTVQLWDVMGSGGIKGKAYRFVRVGGGSCPILTLYKGKFLGPKENNVVRYSEAHWLNGLKVESSGWAIEERKTKTIKYFYTSSNGRNCTIVGNWR